MNLMQRVIAKAMFNPDQWNEQPRFPFFNDTGTNLYSINPLYSTYLSMYRNSLPLRSVITFRADNAAQIGFGVYRKQSIDAREEMDQHPYAKTWDDPNPEATTHTLIRDIMTDLDLFDVTYWKIIDVGTRLLLVRMYPDAVTPIGGNSLAPEYFEELQKDGTTKKYPRHKVFWLHGYGGHAGVSPMEGLRQELNIDQAEAESRHKNAKTGWRTAGAILRPKSAGKWSKVARDNFLDGVTSRYAEGGPYAGLPLLLEEDMKWEAGPHKERPEDYIPSRILTTKMVCLAYHMAPQILGIEGAPYASVMEYKNQLFQIVLGPRFSFIEQGANKQLLPWFEDTEGVYGEFQRAAALQGDPGQQAAIAASAVGGPYMTPDEWRGKVLNMDKLPDGQGSKLHLPGAAAEMAPDPTSEEFMTPKPSDLSVSLAATAATPSGLPSLKAVEIKGESVDAIAGQYKTKATAALREVFKEIEESGGFGNSTEWKKKLAGELQLIQLDVSRAVGDHVAKSAGGIYDAARTVNYWTKASKEEANATIDAMKNGLQEAPFHEVITKAQEKIDDAAAHIVSRAANWAIIEYGRQADMIEA